VTAADIDALRAFGHADAAELVARGLIGAP
jgi:hypothetical protein